MVELQQLTDVVGMTNVIEDPDQLNTYSRDISFTVPRMPKYIVKPTNSGEIQRVVNLCRETQTPLIPVSSGVPHFRGDTIPSVGGAVILDLSRMKKIMRIDRLNRVAMFEPATSW